MASVLWSGLAAFGLSLAVALFLTPWTARTAVRIGLVDRPDTALKTQKEPVPYLGGLAVFVSFLAGIALFARLEAEVLALLLGGALILVLGLLDDMGNLSPWTKLAGQSLAILVVLRAGLSIQIAFLPEWVTLPLSFLWLLGLTNGFNLIDIMDGLAATVGSISCLFLAVLAFSSGQEGSALVALALLGGLAGFLRFNWHPARIYLGDAGSLFTGFMLGALAMGGVYARNHSVSLLAPLLILGVPIFDTLFVMSLRWMRGASVLRGSPDHFPLRLRKWKLTVRQTVAVSASAGVLLGLGALGMVVGTAGQAALILSLTSVLLLAAALWLRQIDMTI